MNEARTAWRDNPVWHQLLGLCPLLAVTTNVSDALAIGRQRLPFWLHPTSPSPGCATSYQIQRRCRHTCLSSACARRFVMLMQAYAFDSFQRIALFLQIVVSNCIILAHAERVARHESIGRVLLASAITGFGFVAVLMLVGAVARRSVRPAAGCASAGCVPHRGITARGKECGRAARMNAEKRYLIFERLRDATPAPEPNSIRLAFELLIAVILSAQATDVSVNRATKQAVPGRQHAGRRCWRSASKLKPLHPHNRALQRQGENVIATCADR